MDMQRNERKRPLTLTAPSALRRLAIAALTVRDWTVSKLCARGVL